MLPSMISFFAHAVCKRLKRIFFEPLVPRPRLLHASRRAAEPDSTVNATPSTRTVCCPTSCNSSRGLSCCIFLGVQVPPEVHQQRDHLALDLPHLEAVQIVNQLNLQRFRSVKIHMQKRQSLCGWTHACLWNHCCQTWHGTEALTPFSQNPLVLDLDESRPVRPICHGKCISVSTCLSPTPL